MYQDTLVFNGINGSNGNYLTPNLTVAQVAALARGEKIDEPLFEDLSHLYSEFRTSHLGVGFGIDADNLAQAGWAVVLPVDTKADVLTALRPLLQLRAEEAGDLYREFVGAEGYRPLDTGRSWLARPPRGKAPGPALPTKVPYYLLLVGDPEEIPFRFQYELDVNYAVGRIHFDSLEDYARYAASVVAADMGRSPSLDDRAVFFGVRNKADRATQMSADHLVYPLVEKLRGTPSGDWKVESYVADDATKATLRSLLHSSSRPALLFTASHGVGFPNGDKLQSGHQGALLCQDWPGPLIHHGPLPTDFYFSADDLADDASLSGQIMFNFACFGAGTPKWDDYAQAGPGRMEIAPRAFVSRLPKRALSLPNGGALAAIGHVDRAWTYSFAWPGTQDDVSVFESAIRAIMAGSRLGFAMEYFGMRHAELAVLLNSQLEEIRYGASADERALANLWTASNDSRSYVITGDPAVRLAPQPAACTSERQ